MSDLASPTSPAREILQRVFGYPAFRGRQEEIVQQVAEGGDALVLMPTGGGKSLCYQIPALLRQGCGIVVSPLIALMQDQVDTLTQLGVKAAYLNSTQDWETVRETEQRLLNGDLDLLYVAPERLLGDRCLDLLDRLQTQGRLALFAIDEAHCVSQWGHDFRPEYLQLSALHQRYPEVPRIALTATADQATREEMIRRLGLGDAQVFVASFDRPNIHYTVVEKDNPRRQLLAFLAGHKGEAGIIYCLSRKKVDETAAWLNTQGFAALPYHAGLDTDTRAQHQRRFLREEGLIVVATIAFGMGIDKPDVRFVAHLDLPKSLEAYYQETGRAGRDGEKAEAWMTYGLQDVVLQRARIDESAAGDEQKRLEAQKLNALLAYCESPRCRRQVLLSYFGENSEPCGNCDLCLEPPELWDGTVAAQKALSAAYRTGQRFGVAHLTDLLRGKSNDKMRQWGHDQLPTFGVGADMDEASWRSVFRQLVAAGLLHADLAEHGALKLTADARPVLKGETRLELRRHVPAKTARSRREPHTRTVVTDLDIADQALFESLRQWRTEEAKEQGVPAYVILHDRTLKELAEMRPATRGHLMQATGMGSAKVERYGEALLALIAAA
ncbi:DNA helicase RecQ [Azospira inquinata]|uniref:DNA helicase RecQ n=1 Tax=Azospira inquinata TaxID=2785627 RepID=A0A975SMH2_9RHOO|nr:DNA helicase RecQ [Azospira inquinata]QWT46117.1 DNA helicase RecQ [Azospira inquinata]QWT48554.1 DNA helicase RecQ [Azospira inquinata]